MTKLKELFTLFFIILFVICFKFESACQTINANDSLVKSTDTEIAFAKHLIRLKEYEQAIFQLKSLLISRKDFLLTDSANYLIAKSYFNLKNFDSSVVFFNKIVENSNKHIEAQLYSSISNAYIGNFTESEKTLSLIAANDSNLQQLLYLNRAGVLLMKNDFNKAKENIDKFSRNWYSVSEQQDNLTQLYSTLIKHKKKSPFIAGALSAIVPGLGKIYTKRVGEGVSAFLITTTMGLVACENLIKDGIKDPKTIIFGSLFGLFYIGNIWGSVISVKLTRDEFNKEINEQIIFNLRVPLRIIYE
jgi:tetratricopeptide (TPR) repeat protein